MAEELFKALELIPSTISSVAGSSTSNNEMFNTSGTSTDTSKPLTDAQIVSPSDQTFNPLLKPLCPYSEATNICNFKCLYFHGNICDLCRRAVLHQKFRKQHTNEHAKQHEVDMEVDREMSCGICLENVMDKLFPVFGILQNCNHCFCLNCIKTWRENKKFATEIREGCPECRIISNSVYPCIYWIDTKEKKEKYIKNYEYKLFFYSNTRRCKYFNIRHKNYRFGKRRNSRYKIH